MRRCRFHEVMLSQPPQTTVRWSDRGNRLWIAYDAAGNRTDSIYCPYRLGNHIPEEIVGIKAIAEDERWFWEIEVQICQI